MKIFVILITLVFAEQCSAFECSQTITECVSDDDVVRGWRMLDDDELIDPDTNDNFRPIQDVLKSLTPTQYTELQTTQKTTLLSTQKYTIRYNLETVWTKRMTNVYELYTEAELMYTLNVVLVQQGLPPVTTFIEYKAAIMYDLITKNGQHGCTGCVTTSFNDMELAYNDPELYELHVSSQTWSLRYIEVVGFTTTEYPIMSGHINNGELVVLTDPDNDDVLISGVIHSFEFPVSLQSQSVAMQGVLGIGKHTGYKFADAITDANDILSFKYGAQGVCTCLAYKDLAGIKSAIDVTKVNTNCEVL